MQLSENVIYYSASKSVPQLVVLDAGDIGMHKDFDKDHIGMVR